MPKGAKHFDSSPQDNNDHVSTSVSDNNGSSSTTTSPIHLTSIDGPCDDDSCLFISSDAQHNKYRGCKTRTPCSSPEVEGYDDEEVKYENITSPLCSQRFITASNTLKKSLYYRKLHPVRGIYISCSFCGRWTLERFYNSEEVKFELLRLHPAVQEVMQLTQDTVYGAELLKGANIKSLLFGSISSSGRTSQSPLTQNTPLEKAFLEMSQLLRAENTQLFTTVPVSTLSNIQKRYMSRHMEHCREMELILNEHGLHAPCNNPLFSSSFSPKEINEAKSITCLPSTSHGVPGTASSTLTSSTRNYNNSNRDTNLRDVLVKLVTRVAAKGIKAIDKINIDDLNHQERLLIALRPKAVATALTAVRLQLSSSNNSTTTKHRSSKDVDDGVVKAIPSAPSIPEAVLNDGIVAVARDAIMEPLYIRNPENFRCNWYLCQQGFILEHRDPLTPTSWPRMYFNICVKCGKLRASSRFYPGCPSTFVCDIACLPQERSCSFPESPVIGFKEGTMSVLRGVQRTSAKANQFARDTSTDTFDSGTDAGNIGGKRNRSDVNDSAQVGFFYSGLERQGPRASSSGDNVNMDWENTRHSRRAAQANKIKRMMTSDGGSCSDNTSIASNISSNDSSGDEGEAIQRREDRRRRRAAAKAKGSSSLISSATSSRDQEDPFLLQQQRALSIQRQLTKIYQHNLYSEEANDSNKMEQKEVRTVAAVSLPQAHDGPDCGIPRGNIENGNNVKPHSPFHESMNNEIAIERYSGRCTSYNKKSNKSVVELLSSASRACDDDSTSPFDASVTRRGVGVARRRQGTQPVEEIGIGPYGVEHHQNGAAVTAATSQSDTISSCINNSHATYDNSTPPNIINNDINSNGNKRKEIEILRSRDYPEGFPWIQCTGCDAWRVLVGNREMFKEVSESGRDWTCSEIPGRGCEELSDATCGPGLNDVIIYHGITNRKGFHKKYFTGLDKL